MTTRCFGILLLLSVAAYGCGDDDDNDNDNVTPAPIAGTAGSATAGTGGSAQNGDGDGDGMDGERVVELIATEFQFTPDRIEADPGERLIVRLRNEGQVEHSLQFELAGGDEVQLEDNVSPGDTAELTVEVPEQSGDYVFFCPISGHRQLGMEGTLAVQ